MNINQQPSTQYQESSILKNILRIIIIAIVAFWILLGVTYVDLKTFFEESFLGLIGYISLYVVLIYGIIESFRNTLISGLIFVFWYLLIIIAYNLLKGFGISQLVSVLMMLQFLGVPIIIMGIIFILIWWKPRSKWG